MTDAPILQISSIFRLRGRPAESGSPFATKRSSPSSPVRRSMLPSGIELARRSRKSILAGPIKVGREYSFSSFRVEGWWRGESSGVQILPAPDDAPRADVESAEHPFILEFPVQVSDLWRLTNYRRMREHRKLTLLLNVLLAGRTNLQPRRSENFWAIDLSDDSQEIKWVQQFYFAKLGAVVIDELSPPAAEQLEEVEPEEYYTKVGHDGKGLRVPGDVDESICLPAAFNGGPCQVRPRCLLDGHCVAPMDGFCFFFLRFSRLSRRVADRPRHYSSSLLRTVQRLLPARSTGPHEEVPRLPRGTRPWCLSQE